MADAIRNMAIDEITPITMDFSNGLTAGDTISSVAWTASAGVTAGTPTNTTTTATAVFSASATGTHVIKCRAVTAAGLAIPRVFTLVVRTTVSAL